MPGDDPIAKMKVSGQRHGSADRIGAGSRGTPAGRRRRDRHTNQRDMKGNGVMPSHPRNMPEQEHSIKERSHELFVEDAPANPAGATKPFKAYLRETPAHPLSPGIRALFWVIGIIVGALLLMAIWRVSHRQAARPRTGAAPVKAAMTGDVGRCASAGSRHA